MENILEPQKQFLGVRIPEAGSHVGSLGEVVLNIGVHVDVGVHRGGVHGRQIPHLGERGAAALDCHRLVIHMIPPHMLAPRGGARWR